jgi:hypothetical protein
LIEGLRIKRNIVLKQLILANAFAKLRAMFRMTIIIISILWASLLLISWSGATPEPDRSTMVTTTSNPA